jgi:hypothetical protein
MGVAVSSRRLARAVSSLGHLGVVSGTALDVVLARRPIRLHHRSDSRSRLFRWKARSPTLRCTRRESAAAISDIFGSCIAVRMARWAIAAQESQWPTT